MAEYNADFPVGTKVRIRARPALETFMREWKYHHPLQSEQLAFAGSVATVKDVGYYHGGDTLYQLTRDHSLVEEMVRHGVLSAEQAARHHLRHLVTNALGGGYSEMKVEVHKLKLESGGNSRAGQKR